MRIYLVEKDNGESYEDYHAYIASAFTSYRKATESLLNEGYKMYPQRDYITRKWELRFDLRRMENQLTPEEIEELKKEDEENGLYDEDYDYDDYYGYEMIYGARIIEIELQE